MTPRGRTDVHIERVSLRGIPLRADESEQLRRVIETELTARLAAAPVTIPRSMRAAAADPAIARVDWTPGDSVQLGRDLGEAVHRRLAP